MDRGRVDSMLIDMMTVLLGAIVLEGVSALANRYLDKKDRKKWGFADEEGNQGW